MPDVMLVVVDPTPPVLVVYGPGDADWAACLMLDMRARGVEVIDGGSDAERARRALGDEPAAIVAVRSWGLGGRVEPSAETVEEVRRRGGNYVVVRSTPTKLGMDDYGGRTHTFALWDGYFQPERSPTGKGSAGFANLLDLVPRSRVGLDLDQGFVFVSYHFASDGPFVHDELRPVLSRAGLASWSYRTSERIPDGDAPAPAGAATGRRRRLDPSVRERLEELVPHASVLLVVSTPEWWSRGAECEVRTARRCGVPVVVLQRPDRPRSPTSILDGMPSITFGSDKASTKRLVAALIAAGARPPEQVRPR